MISLDKNIKSPQLWGLFVVPLGLEPRLFGTKNRRVASYTIGQFRCCLVQQNPARRGQMY